MTRSELPALRAQITAEWARVEPLTRGAEAVGREFGDALDRLFGALVG